MQDGLIASLTNWLKHPFDAKGSAVSWVLFVGLLIIAVWMWNTVLLSIQAE